MSLDMTLVRALDHYPNEYEPQRAEYPAEFRLSGELVEVTIAIMEAADVFDLDQEAPEFPEWPPPGMTAKRSRQIERFLDEPETLREMLTPEEWGLYSDHQREAEATASIAAQKPGKVPVFKFQTSDGWLVHPQECAAIADGLGRLLKDGHARLVALVEEFPGGTLDDARRLIHLWGGYNRMAAECGGYKVE